MFAGERTRSLCPPDKRRIASHLAILAKRIQNRVPERWMVGLEKKSDLLENRRVLMCPCLVISGSRQGAVRPLVHRVRLNGLGFLAVL